jgi:hypothetical protein
MGRKSSVNWVQAKELYLKDSRYSYFEIAEIFGVSKASIQKRGTKEKWPEQRKAYSNATLSKKLSMLSIDVDIAEVNTRHIKDFRMMQAMASRIFIKAWEEYNEGKLKKAALTLKRASDTMIIGIKGERKVLGLPSVLRHSAMTPKDPGPWLELANEIEKSMKSPKARDKD